MALDCGGTLDYVIASGTALWLVPESSVAAVRDRSFSAVRTDHRPVLTRVCFEAARSTPRPRRRVRWRRARWSSTDAEGREAFAARCTRDFEPTLRSWRALYPRHIRESRRPRSLRRFRDASRYRRRVRESRRPSNLRRFRGASSQLGRARESRRPRSLRRFCGASLYRRRVRESRRPRNLRRFRGAPLYPRRVHESRRPRSLRRFRGASL